MVFLSQSRKCRDGKPYLIIDFPYNLLFNNVPFRSLDSAVGVMTWTSAENPIDRGSTAGRGQTFLSSPKRPVRLWGPVSNRHRGSFPGVRRPHSAADHSPHVVRTLRITEDIPLFSHTFSWRLRDNITFTFTMNGPTVQRCTI